MQFDDLEPLEPLTSYREIFAISPLQWIIIICLVILVIAIIYFSVKKFKSRSSLALKLAPFEKAHVELNDLSQSAKDAHETAIDISFILRRAIVQETGDQALYETHEEFSARPDSLHTLPPRSREPLRMYLQRLARMKYVPKNAGDNAQDIIHEGKTLLSQVESEIKEEDQVERKQRKHS